MQYDKIYTKFDYNINKIYKTEIKNEDFNVQNLIEEYKMPYLIDGKLVCIRYNVVIYVSNVISVFLFDKYHILSTNLPFSIDDLNTKKKIAVSYKNSVKITNKKILEIISNNDNIINTLIIPFAKILLQYDVKPYPESNSGFYEFTIDIKFIENNLIPIIHNMNVWVSNCDNIEKSYITEYYKWLNNCVILPHFGLSSHKSYIRPIYGQLQNTTHSTKIQYSIIEKLHLEFNSSRTEIAIHFFSLGCEQIGHIKLKILDNTIELTNIEIQFNYQKQNIAINSIFMLMEILRAYYAPIKIYLSFKYIKQMHKIAFELKFAKNGEYYIKLC